MCAKDVCGFAMHTPLACGSLRLKPAAFRPVFSSEPFLGSQTCCVKPARVGVVRNPSQWGGGRSLATITLFPASTSAGRCAVTGGFKSSSAAACDGRMGKLGHVGPL